MIHTSRGRTPKGSSPACLFFLSFQNRPSGRGKFRRSAVSIECVFFFLLSFFLTKPTASAVGFVGFERFSEEKAAAFPGGESSGLRAVVRRGAQRPR